MSMPKWSLFAVANSTARMTSLVFPVPSAPSTLRPISRTPGATPIYE
jgi:hypothetical protein